MLQGLQSWECVKNVWNAKLKKKNEILLKWLSTTNTAISVKHIRSN